MSGGELVRLHSHEPVASDGFLRLLDDLAASVAIAAGGRLWLVTHGAEGELSVLELGLSDVAALAWQDGCLWVANAWQVWSFVDVLAETGGEGEHLLLGQAAHTTGFLGVSDLAAGADGPVLASSMFGCLAVLDERRSMRPVWSPPGVARLEAGLGCHVTGVAMRGGAPAWVSAANRAGDARSWREAPAGRGVVLDAGGDELAGGLTVPRHPRLHDGALLVAESGTGRLLRIDTASGETETVAVVPGVPGAMAVAGDIALVGVSDPSRARVEGLVGGPAPADRPMRDGVVLVDVRRGEVTGTIELLGRAGPVEAVAVLPGLHRASIAPPRGPVAQSAVVVAPAEPLVRRASRAAPL